MQLALLDPDTPAIMSRLDGTELNYQTVVTEYLERHEDLCCWFYELTAGILEKDHVSSGRENLLVCAAYLHSLLFEDAEMLIDRILETKIKIKEDSLKKVSAQGNTRLVSVTAS